jgi:hypothetical protein
VDKSLYAQYLLERTTDSILETDYGFVTYRYLPGNTSVYIIDIFILPEHRHQRGASSLADRVVLEAKERGCTELLGSVCPSAKGSTQGLRVLLGYGMKLKSSDKDFIIFTKEIH